MKKSVTILGTKYNLVTKSSKELLKIAKGGEDKFIYGMCDFDTKTIYINECLKNIRVKRETLTHEILHAFFYESGLCEQCDFALNEELIDWIALQFPKIMISIDETNIFEDEMKYAMKKEKENDTARNNKSTSTSTKQDGVRNANKHRAKILR